MSPKILIIDDDDDFIDDLILFLNGDYQFLTAYDSRHALEILKTEKVDLILLDIVMPACLANVDDEEGIALLKYIRQSTETSSIPVIIVSGDGSSEKRDRCRELGISEYVGKPVGVGRLKGLIVKSLAS